MSRQTTKLQHKKALVDKIESLEQEVKDLQGSGEAYRSAIRNWAAKVKGEREVATKRLHELDMIKRELAGVTVALDEAGVPEFLPGTTETMSDPQRVRYLQKQKEAEHRGYVEVLEELVDLKAELESAQAERDYQRKRSNEQVEALHQLKVQIGQ